jgi:dihydrofolate reductase
MFSIVVGISANGGIGYNIDENNQGLPWKCSIDMKFFRNLTKHNYKKIQQRNAVIMGRNTHQSLNKELLPGRVNVVISSVLWNHHKKEKEYIYSTIHDDLIINSNFIICKTLNSALMYCNKQNFDNVYVIGGSQLYKEALCHNDLDRIYVSFVPDCCVTHTPTIFFPLSVSDIEEKFPNKELFLQGTVDEECDYQVFTYKNHYKV